MSFTGTRMWSKNCFDLLLTGEASEHYSATAVPQCPCRKAIRARYSGPGASNLVKVKGMKAVLLLIVGALLLLVGVSSLPRLLARIGREDDFEVLGRVTVVALELALGAWLIVRGIRAAPRRT
jgi:hypothetical protein